MKYNPKENTFDDGYRITWNVNDNSLPKLWRSEDDHTKNLTAKKYRSAVVSQSSKVLMLRAGRYFQRNVSLPGPITVGDLLDEMERFFNKALSDRDRSTLQANHELRNWSSWLYPNYQCFFEYVKTYGALCGDHVFFDGFCIDKDSISPGFLS